MAYDDFSSPVAPSAPAVAPASNGGYDLFSSPVEKPATPASYDSDKGPYKDLPMWLRPDNAFSRFTDQAAREATFGLGREVKPVTEWAEAVPRWVAAKAGYANPGVPPAEAYHKAKQAEVEKQRQSEEEFGMAPAIVGSLGGVRSAARAAGAVAPTFGSTVKGATAFGAGAGAVQGLTEGDDSALRRVGNLAAGAGIGAGTGAVLGALGYGAGKALGAIGRSASDVTHPEFAANRRTAEAVDQSGLDIDKIYSQMAPSAKRATTDPQVLEIIQRANNGETRQEIAQNMGLSPYVVSERLAQLADKSRVPTNFIDAAKMQAREEGRMGADYSITDLAKTSAALDPQAAKIAAQRLVQRHADQPERIGDIITQASKGPGLEEVEWGLSDILNNKANAKYNEAAANAQPFDLRPTLQKWREVERQSAGDVKTKLSRAIDRFFKPAYEEVGTYLPPEAPISPNPPTAPTLTKARYNLAMKDADRRIAAETKKGVNADQELIGHLEDLKTGLTEQYNARTQPPSPEEPTLAPLRYNRFADPIDDLKRYKFVREALDHDIEVAKKPNGDHTIVSRKLSGLRRELNQVMREANPLHAQADDMFSGAKTAQGIVERGGKAALRAGPAYDNALKFYQTLTEPEQQELFRAAFKHKLVGDVLNTPEGRTNAARRFSSQKAKDFLGEVFPGKEGDRLLTDLAKENIGFETLMDVFGGSRTAPLWNSMENIRDAHRLAQDLAHGNVPGLIARLAKRAATHSTAKEVGIIVDKLTQTDPAQVLPFIQGVKQAGLYNQQVDSIVRDRARRIGYSWANEARSLGMDIRGQEQRQDQGPRNHAQHLEQLENSPMHPEQKREMRRKIIQDALLGP